MKFTPLSNGGRILEGSTPFGDFRVEWDSKGRLVSERLHIKPFDVAAPSHHAPCPFGPGTALACLIRITTLGRVKPCKKCQCRKRTMDQWGWWGLLKRLCTAKVQFNCEGCKAKARIRDRAAVCAQCEHMRGINDTSVDCGLKGMIDLKAGVCPDQRWQS